MQENQNINQLFIYRRRRGLSQKQVARMLGHRNESILSRYETGDLFPTLEAALKLEVLYRVPVAFLFPGLYGELREEIRSLESRLPKGAKHQSPL